MDQSDSGRNQVKTPADAKALLADSVGQPVEFVRFLGASDVYRQGRVAQVVPGLWSGMHPRVLRALVTRRVATLIGECPGCGALAHVLTDRLELRHSGRCPASNERLERLHQKYGAGIGRGHRLYDPDPGSSSVEGRELWEVDTAGMKVDVLRVGRAGQDGSRGEAA